MRVRVTAVFRDQCLLQFPDGERTAQVTGRFRFEAESRADFPAVGDWVNASVEGPNGALVHSIEPRRSVLSRKSPGQTTEEQVLAANVDIAFIVTSFNDDFNARRLERYLLLAKEAAVEPVILINKSDMALADDPRPAEAAALSRGLAVHVVSAVNGDGLDEISSRLKEGKTGIFLGSSGVGKSTLLNRLLGKDVQSTEAIRLSDSKGRHTTTSRQMFPLAGGGFVIDTPGLREIQLWSDASILPDVYEDIAAVAKRCRFRDCRHQMEVGCAVKEALDSGELSRDRWAGYTKLQKELRYLERKRDPELRANTKKRWKKIHKDIRDLYKKGKRNPG